MVLNPQRQGVPGFDAPPPAIQQEIFAYLDGDNASLFAAIRVSKACYNCCIGMMWRESSQKRLTRVPTLDRRQHYATMIRIWELGGIGPSGVLFNRLYFPLLEDISYSFRSLPVKQLRDYLKNVLHTLQLLQHAFDTTDLCIDMAGGSAAINTLLPGAPATLTVLELQVEDTSNSVCPAIGGLSNLHITFGLDRDLSQKDLDHFSNSSKLEECHIERCVPDENDDDPLWDDSWLTDSYFKKWITKLPQLRVLHLDLNSSTITQAALQSLGDSCPFLTSCHLTWGHDLGT
ncbi:hypothetical protein QM012_004392 [Aureobasidium pullulans]|uniref:F-box domain-containing protein n=1 Tax=Aureobasidium pullulans TaxID=5580 RepID=A0ABR0TT02_AURPU